MTEPIQLFSNPDDVFSSGALGGLDNSISDHVSEDDAKAITLGAVCWWSVSSAMVDHHRFEKVMIRNGIPSEWVNAPHTWRDALLMAYDAVKRSDDWPLELRKISLGTQDGKKPAVHALMHTVVDVESARVRSHQVGTVFFNNATGGLDVRWDPGADFSVIKFDPQDFEIELHRYVRLFKDNFTSHDVRNNVLDIVTGPLAGFRVRPSGGIYFVARQHIHYLDALNDVIREISGDEKGRSSGMFRLEVLDSAKAKATLMVSYAQFLESEIRKLNEGLAEAEVGDRNIRKTTLVERIDRLNELRAQAERYVRMFDSKVGDLENALRETAMRLQAAVNA